MSKTRCKKKKIKEIEDPKFLCQKCNMTAEKKKDLCQPEKK